MKKFSLFLISILIGVIFSSGCGKNEKKTSLLTGTSVDSYESSPMASAVVALFKAAGTGAGAGTTSYGAPAKVGTKMQELGEADAEGKYTIIDPMGMTIKIQFKKGTDVVYFNLEGPFGTSLSNLYLYASQSLSETDKILASSIGLTTTFPRYIPAMFCKLSDNTPIAWHPISSLADLQNLSSGLLTFIQSNFPDSMTNTVTGNIPRGTINLTLNTTMTQKATDANPAHMTGSGTITLHMGQVLSVTVDMCVGANGPVSGTQTFTSSTGETGTLTFHSDGSVSGVVKSTDGTTVATIKISADGTGTYTDIATGKTYIITGAA